MKKTEFQFELWEECNSKCSFCYLGNNNRLTTDDDKIHNIDDALLKISDDSFFDNIRCLGFIGGEFFQGQLKNQIVKNHFLSLMKKANQLLNDKIIEELWISASLLLGDQCDLYETLQLFNDVSKIWILTSYDTIGRFHSEKEKIWWLNNIEKLRTTFPSIKINITSIVTGDFINRFLNNTLDLYQIAEHYNCSVFLKPTSKIEGIESKIEVNKLIGDFFPTRSQMLKFLIKYRSEFSDFLYDKLFNINYRSEYLYLYGHRQQFSHRIKDVYQEFSQQKNSNFQFNEHNSTCNHSTQYQCYIDSNKCVICDKNVISQNFS